MCGRSISSIAVFAVTLAVAIGIFAGGAAAQPGDNFIQPDNGGKDVSVAPGDQLTGFGSFDPADAPAVTSNDKFPDSLFDEKDLFQDFLFDDDEEYQDGSDPVVVG